MHLPHPEAGPVMTGAVLLAVLLVVGLAGFYAWDIWLGQMSGPPASHVTLQFKKS